MDKNKLLLTSKTVLIIIFLLAVNLASGPSSKTGPLTATLKVNDALKFPLAKHIWYYKDSSLNDIIQKAIQKRTNRFCVFFKNVTNVTGNTNICYWLTFTLKNTASQTASLFFWLADSGFDRLCHNKSNGYLIKENGSNGAYFRFSQWFMANRAFLFNIVLNLGESKTFYVFADKRGQGMYKPMYLWKDTAVGKAGLCNYYIAAFLAGILVIATVFNLFSYLTSKDKIHLYYLMFVLCLLFLFIEQQGPGSQLIYPAKLYSMNYMLACVLAIANAFMIEIMQQFVGQYKNNGFFFYFAQVVKFSGYGIAAIVFSILFLYPSILVEPIVFYTVALLSLMAAVSIVSSVVQRGLRGNKLAWVYLIAISPLLFGTFVFIQHTLAINKFNLMWQNSLAFVLTIGIVLLWLALTYRYNTTLLLNKRLLLENLKLQEQIMIADEGERAGLGRDLHDNLGGTLAAVKLNVTSFERTFAGSDGNLRNFYQNTVTLLNKAGDDLRSISRGLIPGDFSKKGVTQILEEKVEQLNSNQHVHFTFISNNSEITFNLTFELAIYRIFIELINNIMKHGDAGTATLQYTIDKDKNLIAIMADDDSKVSTTSMQDSSAIKNIKERISLFNGSVNIDSSPGGSTVMIEFPFNHTNLKYGA